MWVSKHLEAFLEMLAAERGAAPLTLAAYQNDLSNLAAFLAARHVPVEAAEAASLHAYLANATTTRLAPRTLARRISAMRQFYKFLLLEGVREDDPTGELDTPRLGRPLPKILSESEIRTLIDAARGLPGDEGIRLYCILELLYATGLRISELVTLPLAAARPSRWLFPSRGRAGHLTRQRAGQLLKELAAKAGLDPEKLSPHVLRHAF